MDQIIKYMEDHPLRLIEFKIKENQVSKDVIWYFRQGCGIYTNCVTCYTSRGPTLVRLVK